ncbi:MAG: hypothetical protein ACRDQ5_20595 [Sciscionella sp.]
MTEPILVSIAGALASRAATGLYELVKRAFSGRPHATRALEAAEGAAEGSPEVERLAEELAAAQREDPAFGEELRTKWNALSVRQQAQYGGVTNQISGEVSGRVVQARDIHGDISF